jgi:U32 family peptidase
VAQAFELNTTISNLRDLTESDLSPYDAFYLFKGSPNRGGLDYRVCLEAWQLYSGGIKREDRVALRNEAFFLLEDIPYLIDLGVRCMKIQGREYTTSLVRNIVRFYRELLDAYAVNTPGEPFDLNPWKARSAVIQTERDRQRHAGTLALLAEAPVAAAHHP